MMTCRNKMDAFLSGIMHNMFANFTGQEEVQSFGDGFFNAFLCATTNYPSLLNCFRTGCKYNGLRIDLFFYSLEHLISRLSNMTFESHFCAIEAAKRLA